MPPPPPGAQRGPPAQAQVGAVPAPGRAAEGSGQAGALENKESLGGCLRAENPTSGSSKTWGPAGRCGSRNLGAAEALALAELGAAPSSAPPGVWVGPPRPWARPFQPQWGPLRPLAGAQTPPRRANQACPATGASMTLAPSRSGNRRV